MKKENIFLKIWRIIYMPIVYLVISTVVGAVAMIFMGVIVGIQMGASAEQMALLDLEAKLMETYYQYAMLLTAISALIILPICIYLIKKDKKREIFYSGEVTYEKVEAINYIPVFLLGIASCIAFNNLIGISGLIELFPGFEEFAEVIYGGGIILQIFSIVIVVPIVEELLFRGLVYKRLRGYTKVNVAIVVSALFFGVYHMNVVQGLYAFLIGVLFAYIYEKYKSIWAPIIFHISANGMSVLLTEISESSKIFENTVFFVVLTIVTLCLTIFVTLWIYKNINPIKNTLDRSALEDVR